MCMYAYSVLGMYTVLLLSCYISAVRQKPSPKCFFRVRCIRVAQGSPPVSTTLEAGVQFHRGAAGLAERSNKPNWQCSHVGRQQGRAFCHSNSYRLIWAPAQWRVELGSIMCSSACITHSKWNSSLSGETELVMTPMCIGGDVVVNSLPMTKQLGLAVTGSTHVGGFGSDWIW